ncbi:hypothetical protein [Marinoscillum pacificum]|uniref:hypothetical protein n=1 Tax=Marinoscillum pacificum TaxID=392723 RepID=UPI002157396B|nr:hypothetical protein [Marinoscillum pacificum]
MFYFLTLPFKKAVIFLGSILFIILCIQLVDEGVHTRPNEYLIANKMSQISFSLFFFYVLFERGTEVFIDKSPLFWINTGILFYFAGSLFTTVMASEILSGPMPWLFHNIANTMKNTLIAIGLWKARQTT